MEEKESLKNIWLINHYAINTYFDKAGRHFYFAKFLKEKNYNSLIVCASENHNSDQSVQEKGKNIVLKSTENCDYAFIKTSKYKGNGLSRMMNMWSFYRNLLKSYKKIIKIHGAPDVIVASSVHPLAVLAGQKIARKLKIKCIVEIRDLWPESIVAYGKLKQNSLIAKLLYRMEKKIYARADKIIFTMEGGKDYIVEKQWQKSVNLDKIYNINNGIHLPDVVKNIEENILDDESLREDCLKVIYVGSIRLVNNLQMLIDSAKIVSLEKPDVKFIIYGDGTEKTRLQSYCKEHNINNVLFKGFVEKKYIPYILSKSDINILNYRLTPILRFGASQNKLFDYLASGKPIICNAKGKYNLIERYNCGIITDEYSAESTAKAIIAIANLDKEELKAMGDRAMSAAKDFDFRILTEKLIDIIEH